jgi:ubiquinone/menaquinone biosynthesis C-methylase UbiE
MSWQDLERIIDNPIFTSLKNYFLSKRLSINKFGPLMGAANIRKLSDSCVKSILSADFVLLKGCRIHEMLQGGLNVDTFSSHVVSRSLSEIVAGYSSSNNPLLFFHLGKKEFAFFGVNKENSKTIKFYNMKEINSCMSTLSDHERRKKLSSPEEIISEFNLLLKQAENYIGDKKPLYDELNMLAEKLLLITKETYDKMCIDYSALRTEELHEFEQKVWDMLVDYTNRYIQSNKPEDIHLLDVGTGHGRDVLYSTKLGYNTKGIDNSDGFIKILKEYERTGKLKPNSIVKCDMRNLEFENESFDVVRQHATLLHIPIIAHGYTVDLALSETHRVLKPKGLMNVIVKTREGFDFVDSGEGLGGRVFQFFTHKTLNEVITRNGFTILQTSDEFGKRKAGTVSWISVIAQKD